MDIYREQFKRCHTTRTPRTAIFQKNRHSVNIKTPRARRIGPVKPPPAAPPSRFRSGVAPSVPGGRGIRPLPPRGGPRRGTLRTTRATTCTLHTYYHFNKTPVSQPVTRTTNSRPEGEFLLPLLLFGSLHSMAPGASEIRSNKKPAAFGRTRFICTPRAHPFRADYWDRRETNPIAP